MNLLFLFHLMPLILWITTLEKSNMQDSYEKLVMGFLNSPMPTESRTKGLPSLSVNQDQLQVVTRASPDTVRCRRVLNSGDIK